MTERDRGDAVGEEQALVIKRAERPLLGLEQRTDHEILEQMMTC